MNNFLPISREDMQARGWDACDFVCITGDAYVDHPSFGIAVIARVLEAEGFRVGVIAQPDWKSTAGFKQLGRPRLGFLISGGNIDSMVSNYTVAGKPRRDDMYSPGRRGGMRPDRAAIVYAVRAREAYKGVPIILGGLEASLRRLSHYDYWSNKLRRPIILDAKADLVVYGMGEQAIRQIAARLAEGEGAQTITDIRGTCVLKALDAPLPAAQESADNRSWPPKGAAGPEGSVLLPSWDDLNADRHAYARSFAIQLANTDPFQARPLAEPHGDRLVWQNPPPEPLSGAELDRVYALPFTRQWHPVYAEAGGVSSIDEVRFSVTASRGCFGDCSFCSLTFHQGRIVQGRSHESVLAEAREIIAMPDFKGYIHDVGGPTANFRGPACAKQGKKGSCPGKSCLYPSPCPSLDSDHGDFLRLLRKVRALPGVKKAFVRSGIRYDFLLAAGDESVLYELCEHHVSGQLKVAPEHVDDAVLAAMGKPPMEVYELFKKRFEAVNKRLDKKQFLVPYFISSHPGSTLDAAIRLAEFLRDQRVMPEQVQDFYPTPGTVATCMYYSGIDPRSGAPVHVPNTPREKAMQRALLQYGKPENYKLVRAALEQAGRLDLIGDTPRCLIRDYPPRGQGGPARPERPGKPRQPSGKARGAAPKKTGAPGQSQTRHSKKREQGKNVRRQAR